MLAESIKDISPFDPVVIFVHDWGAVYGFALQNMFPELVLKMIVLDVGPVGLLAPPSIKGAATVVVWGIAYQYVLIFAFLLSFLPFVGPPLGDRIASWQARKLKPAAKRDFRISG